MAQASAQPVREEIAGTTIFDGAMARRGYALNAMCFSFNDAANRDAFRRNEAAYCDRFRLTPEQLQAVADREVLGLLAAGGNIYYLAKLAGIWGLNVQDVGAAQTGMSAPEFKAMLLGQAETKGPGKTAADTMEAVR